MIEIIDDFLPKKDHRSIFNLFTSSKFPWNMRYGKVASGGVDNGHLDDFQFTHLFYANYVVQSEYIEILNPIIEKIYPAAIIKIKANLNHRTDEKYFHGYHIDFKDCVTAVYYVNSNDGETKFENGQSVDSVENRIVIFDSNIKHTGSTCTDERARIVINFNYFPYPEGHPK